METVQEILQTDSRPVPPVLKQESVPNLGTADIPREIFFSHEYHNLEPTFRTSFCSTERYINYHYYFESTN